MMNKFFMVVAGLAAVLIASSAFAGTLRIGDPVVDGDVIAVPVFLEGDVGDGVAALNFQFNYDSSIVEPQSINAGAAAQQAGKDVLTNMKEPGSYTVVLAGLNNAVLEAGEVISVILQRRSDADNTNISVTGTTMASLKGKKSRRAAAQATSALSQLRKKNKSRKNNQPRKKRRRLQRKMNKRLLKNRPEQTLRMGRMTFRAQPVHPIWREATQQPVKTRKRAALLERLPEHRQRRSERRRPNRANQQARLRLERGLQTRWLLCRANVQG